MRAFDKLEFTLLFLLDFTDKRQAPSWLFLKKQGLSLKVLAELVGEAFVKVEGELDMPYFSITNKGIDFLNLIKKKR